MGIIINGLTDTVTAADGSLNIGGDVTIPGELSYDDVTNIDSVGVVTARNGLRVTGGSVGIGTDNPTSALEIRTTTTNSVTHYRNNASNGGVYFGVRGTDLGAASAGDAYIYSYNSGINLLADGTGDINFATGGTASKVRITSSGSVGIGTDNPGQKLDIDGNIRLRAGNTTTYATTLKSNLNATHTSSLTSNVNNVNEFELIGSYADSGGSNPRIAIGAGGQNVGVGEDAPNTRLHIVKDNDVAYTVDQATQNSNNQIKIENHSTTTDSFVSMAMRARACDFHLGVKNNGSDNSGRLFLVHQDTTNKEVVSVTSGGNIGINDTDPRTGLTITKYGTAATTNANTYSMPAGRWVSTWNTSTANNIDYWAGFGGSGYAVSSGSVNIALASNHNNTNQQAGMYIAGEATSLTSADFTIGKIVSGSAVGSSDVAGNQRATKSELMRVTSGGDVLVGGHSARTYDDTGDTNVILDIYGGATAGKRGILSLSGRVGDDNGDIGTIWFNNDNNSGASPGNQMKLSAAIQAKIVTSDGNTGSDAGAYLQFFTKPESSALAEAMRITSDGKFGVGLTSPESKVQIRNTTTYGKDTYATAGTGGSQPEPPGTFKWDNVTPVAGHGRGYRAWVQSGDAYPNASNYIDVLIRNSAFYRITLKRSHSSVEAAVCQMMIYGLANSGNSNYPVVHMNGAMGSGTSTPTVQSGHGRGSSSAVASFYWEVHSYNVNTHDTIIRITTTGSNNQGIVALIEKI